MKLLYSFLRYLRNLNLFILRKHPFFFILRTDLKMAKAIHKGDLDSIAKHQSDKTFKKVAKAEVDLTMSD